MERLNDNEVEEVARMQQKIDSYEGFIKALFIMMRSNQPINYPMFCETDFSQEMSEIWRWAKEHKFNK